VRIRRNLLLKFWNLLYISGTAAATNFKFGVRIQYNEYYLRMQIRDKVGVA